MRERQKKWHNCENSFSLPSEVFDLCLERGPLLVYVYLVHHKYMHRDDSNLSCAVISSAVGLAESTTVRWKDGRTRNGNLLYTITPIDQVLKERERELLSQLKIAETQRKWDVRVKRMTARQGPQREKSTTPNQ